MPPTQDQIPPSLVELMATELHAHLYGCIDAASLWEWGRDLWKTQEPRLVWYAQEYQKLCGKTPLWETYWKDSQGFDRLKEDFEMRGPGTFARFQAGFNLAIALFPLNPDNTDFFRKILLAQRQSGTEYGEYRIVIPPHFSDDAVHRYILSIVRTLTSIKQDHDWISPIVLSLNRDPTLFCRQHRILRQTLASLAGSTTDLGIAGIVGIDLCGTEERNPPRAIAQALKEVLLENKRRPHQRLSLLYHVGESFTDKSLPSAIRWVHEAACLGAHRLGHCIALGVDPGVYLDETRPDQLRLSESKGEHLDHLRWLLRYGDSLQAGGYSFNQGAVKKMVAALSTLNTNQLMETMAVPEASMPFKERVESVRSLQQAVLQMIADTGAAIEVCPTSNHRIGQIPSWGQHSLAGFCRYNDSYPQKPVALVIGADDPGLFNQTLRQEWSLIQTEFPQLLKWLPDLARWSQQLKSPCKAEEGT